MVYKNLKKGENKMDNEQNNAAQNNLPPVLIHTQYIKDFSLEIPHAPEIFRELTAAPKRLMASICMMIFIMSV